MKLPPLTDEELKPFLEEGVWVAKLATINPDGTIRITPLTYGGWSEAGQAGLLNQRERWSVDTPADLSSPIAASSVSRGPPAPLGRLAPKPIKIGA